MPKAIRVLGYARVSSEEQARGSSLRDQQEAIRSYAKARGVVVADLYVEAESAVHEKIEKREQIQTLLRDVRPGDLVLCDKLDRWSRDPEFTYRSVREILAKGATFYAVSDRCDPSTPEGDTALGFRVLFAREEHKRIKERTVGTRNLLRARGYYVEGTPPFGYRRALPKGSRGAEKNVLVEVPEAAEKVRLIFRMVVAGRSLSQICQALDLGRKRVWSSIHCRSYLGEVRTPSGWIRGLHEPLVDADLFERANEMFAARRYGGARPRSAPARTDTWVLRDVAHCAACGRRMSAAYGNNRDVDHYYRCWWKCQAKGPRSNTGTFVRVDMVEPLFSPFVIERLSELREEIAKGSEPSSTRLVSFDDKKAKLLRRRQRHLEAHADDLMTGDELRAALTRLDEELLKISASEARLPKRVEPEERRERLREIATLEQAWLRATPVLRRRIVNLLAEKVLISTEQAPVPVWRPKESINAEVLG
jgi:DNA invertase Pin-like site-specific DNA recombinase